jgi:hypothetical protein
MSSRFLRLFMVCAAVLGWSARSPETFRAVRGIIVNSDATLIVNDANVIGGSALTDARDSTGFAAPGIDALDNNLVRLVLGDIRGGNASMPRRRGSAIRMEPAASGSRSGCPPR